MSELAIRDEQHYLATISEVRSLVGRMESVGDAKSLADQARAAQVWAERSRLGLAQVNLAVMARLWAERRAGELLIALREDGSRDAGMGGDRKSQSHEATVKLDDLGITKHESSRFQKLAESSEEEFEQALKIAAENGRVSAMSVAQRLVASAENEWYTPSIYIEAARRLLGQIDLDPATSVLANGTVRATHYFTKDDDGMSKPWFGRIWLNPPYGRLAGAFVSRLVLEHQAGEVTAAVALVNAHATDTEWFQQLWDHTLCFTDHRIDFDSGEREKKTTSTHGSIFAYLGPELDAFRHEFSAFGAIVRRV